METREIVGDREKQIAKEWFEELRDMICDDFEKIEILKESGEFSSRPTGKFEKKQTWGRWRWWHYVCNERWKSF